MQICSRKTLDFAAKLVTASCLEIALNWFPSIEFYERENGPHYFPPFLESRAIEDPE